LVLAKRIRLAKEVEKEIGWDEKIVPGVKIGNWISFHWAQACEILDGEEVKNLERYTKKTIDSVNKD
jgi:hydrogenase maturation factor